MIRRAVSVMSGTAVMGVSSLCRSARVGRTANHQSRWSCTRTVSMPTATLNQRRREAIYCATSINRLRMSRVDTCLRFSGQVNMS